MKPETALIQRYLDCGDPQEQAALMEELIFHTAAPQVHRTVFRKLGSSPEADREDAASDVLAELIGRLKKLKSEGGAPIEHFAAYVSACAHNRCDQHLRRRYPQRYRLKNRLRYLIGTMPGFRLWQDPERGWLCGRSLWQGRVPIPVPGDWTGGAAMVPGEAPASLVTSVLERAGAPVDFDDLVGLFATLWGVQDKTLGLDAVGETASPEPSAEQVLAGKQDLEALWAEIVNLPAPQRSALLLNLRDPAGESAVWLLPVAGIATVRKIAETLGIAVEEFAQLWPKLPVSDAEIAERLGVTRQQVINLRQAARQRLARKVSRKVERRVEGRAKRDS